MNKTKIDWPWKNLYTWNPIVGCKHGCSYCYAKKISNRFKMIRKWEEPQLFIQRLKDPIGKKPMNIFVGSMCDLFGGWVSKEWIQSVLETVKWCPRHTFIFLTKNPKRYSEFDFPANCWLGTTITNLDDFYKRFTIYENKTFLSVEPLLGPLSDEPNGMIALDNYDLIVTGSMTGPGAKKPDLEWVESIEHPNIYYKESIRKLYPEFKNKESYD